MKKKLRNKAVGLTTGYTTVFHKIRSSALLLLVLLVLFMCYGCCKLASPEEEPYATIEILQNGVVQDTIIVKEENDGDIYPVYDSKSQIGEIEVDYVEHYNNCNPNLDPTIYFFTIDRKDGSYTIFKSVSPFDTLRLDYQLDFDTVNDSLNCGTMYHRGYGFVRDAKFSVWLDSVFIDSLFTDSIGRFETSIEPDNFSLKSSEPEYYPDISFILQDGYGDYFVFDNGGYITDDHYFINEIAKIPTINIIHLDPASVNGTFYDHWHTVNDNLEQIDPATLKVVGQTVLETIFRE